MLVKIIFVFAVLSTFTLELAEGKRRLLRPVPASVVRQLLKDANREDAVPEGRVISHGLVAVKGLALGFAKGVLGVALADSLAAQGSSNAASNETTEICFSTMDGTWTSSGNRKARQVVTPTRGTPTAINSQKLSATSPIATTATAKTSDSIGQREARQTLPPTPPPTTPPPSPTTTPTTGPPTSPTTPPPTSPTTLPPTSPTTLPPTSPTTLPPTSPTTPPPTSPPTPPPTTPPPTPTTSPTTGIPTTPPTTPTTGVPTTPTTSPTTGIPTTPTTSPTSPTTTTTTSPTGPTVSCVILYKNGQSSKSKL